jgi:hypothetical protein
MLEDNKRVITSVNRRTDNTMVKRTNNDSQNTTQKTKLQQREPPKKLEVNPCAPEGSAVPAPRVIHVE